MNETSNRSTQSVARPAIPLECRAPQPPRRWGLPSPQRIAASSAVYVILCAYAVAVVFPMFWLLYSSLKADRDIFLYPFKLPQIGQLHWENFSNAWYKGMFNDYFFNSVMLTVSSVVVTIFLAAMTAYALARFKFGGAKALYFYFLAGLMIPIQLAIVPLFFQMRSLDMLNSRFGLFLVYLAFGFPFSIFVLTGFFKSLPASLHESALLDGASEFGRILGASCSPVARPGLITVAIFLFLGNWNEFFVAFICLSGKGSEHLRTLPLGLANITIVSQYRSDWGVAFAGLTLMMLPTGVVYMLLQKYLTKGITAGAVKG